MDNNQTEKEELAGRREALKRLGMLSGVVAGLVFPVVLSGCPMTWANGDPEVVKKVGKKGQVPRPE